MAAEELMDVIIFGASGFTGKYVVRELLKFAESAPGGGPRRVGIAGRSKAKLSNSLKWALEGKPSPTAVSIFEANVDDPNSLASMCKRTRLLLNCVGPYRKYGEPVVAACVQAGVDYLDITGEPEFMERMEAKFDEQARTNGCLLVSACGYDSIPAEFGALHNARQFQAPALPQTCDSYLVLSSAGGGFHGNFGTWESAVLGIAHQSELQALRKSRPRRARPQIPGLLESSHGIVHYEKNSGTWAVKLPSADAIVVRRTFAKKLENPEGLSSVEDDNPEFLATKQQKWNDIKPVHFGVYASFKQFSGVLGFFLLGIVLFIMAQFKVGRSLLLKYPQIFSFGVFLKEGPSEDDVKNATFQQWFVGKGFSDSTKQITKSTKPDKQIVTRISGPEIGYITTPICLVQCALLVLDRRSTLPKGGVLTPGAAFGTTDLIDRLEQNGVKFDVISTSQI
ncbi:hypothetical protein MPTK1_1g25030 [Marchantia polymorpha subsp. ruderalis]|uniref:Saccharopine dehydrogenase NADP binding domain-containing protein n=2 Tax=Marchantia polymorpha TaxID=3197 RepID=A0A176W4K9_MARPO|nr:hypothetical protein AXG93_3911s1550 [Marchantia polymorpha subsp. ruderalis]PTQ36744.1 hypothetical protein MARPO_0061s0022 [Marchantia polymorpha]PTQ36745.1 hypothetical protein MARPO_0061s0022 [Marchantia polymorpha]BBM99941.1 hypothetical protein Mp_1g25030 [Marchantia polymorpha subsp. ruderalis]BBM99942.1 hypothetical protein Mp_1g25030 [Marchantia polymorpha subsp. ruderalis]|eukprot:PTQ36744.1 hypothetical protein MARPO_0061s0022 [Marchantia polymorpha]